MKRVWVGDDPLFAGWCRSLLQARGIGTVAPFEHLAGATGEIPFLECWPQVWVVDDDDAPLAERVLREALAGARDAAAWTCPDCGEVQEPQFTACWRCAPAD